VSEEGGGTLTRTGCTRKGGAGCAHRSGRCSQARGVIACTCNSVCNSVCNSECNSRQHGRWHGGRLLSRAACCFLATRGTELHAPCCCASFRQVKASRRCGKQLLGVANSFQEVRRTACTRSGKQLPGGLPRCSRRCQSWAESGGPHIGRRRDVSAPAAGSAAGAARLASRRHSMALLAAVRQRRLLLLLLLQHGNMAGTRPLSTVVHHIRKHIVFVAHCFSAFTPTAIFLTYGGKHSQTHSCIQACTSQSIHWHRASVPASVLAQVPE